MSGSKLCSLSIQKRTLAYLQTHSVAVSCGRSRRVARVAPRAPGGNGWAICEPGCFLGPLVVIPYPPHRYLYSPKPLYLYLVTDIPNIAMYPCAGDSISA